MRVAMHTGQLLQPVPGGIGRYQRAMLDHLPDAGAEVVAFAAGPRPPRVQPRVPWIDLGAPHGSVRYECWHRLRRPRVRIDADVVHAPSLAIPPVDDLPLVATIHDIAFKRVPNVTTRRGRSFHEQGLNLAREHATRILAPSEFTRRELVAEGFVLERIDVVPFGVEPPVERDAAEIDAMVAQSGARAPYVLTVGTIEPRKQLPLLVHAVEELRREFRDLTLVVVGPRGWGDVQGLDRSFVRVLGTQPWAAVDALYRRASLFAVASLYEGFGLPALEAMARGCPTVATTGSAMEEFVDGVGALFSPRDVDACRAAMREILADVDYRDRLSRLGRERSASLTWRRSAERHVETFRRAREQRGS